MNCGTRPSVASMSRSTSALVIRAPSRVLRALPRRERTPARAGVNSPKGRLGESGGRVTRQRKAAFGALTQCFGLKVLGIDADSDPDRTSWDGRPTVPAQRQ